MEAICAEGLTRSYNGTLAVNDLRFSVESGEIFGFLGPNGAGKTTTINLLTGQLRPDKGWAVVAGLEVRLEDERLKRRIGVVPEYQNLYERMTGTDNLRFSASLYGIDRLRVDAVLEQVGLNERGQDPVSRYSNGMKQRLLIARALLHQPAVLFLDEPTRGLDPGAARELRELIKALAREGVTVFLTTHYMEEADKLCKRVAIIDQGRIAALDTPANLKANHGSRLVAIRLPDGQRFQFSLEKPEDRRQLGQLVEQGRFASLHSGEASLEEVFLQLTGRRMQV